MILSVIPKTVVVTVILVLYIILLLEVKVVSSEVANKVAVEPTYLYSLY